MVVCVVLCSRLSFKYFCFCYYCMRVWVCEPPGMSPGVWAWRVKMLSLMLGGCVRVLARFSQESASTVDWSIQTKFNQWNGRARHTPVVPLTLKPGARGEKKRGEGQRIITARAPLYDGPGSRLYQLNVHTKSPAACSMCMLTPECEIMRCHGRQCSVFQLCFCSHGREERGVAVSSGHWVLEGSVQKSVFLQALSEVCNLQCRLQTQTVESARLSFTEA